MATSRPSRVSRARYTSPIPPTPNSPCTSKTPMRRPASSTRGGETRSATSAPSGASSTPAGRLRQQRLDLAPQRGIVRARAREQRLRARRASARAPA